jgi:hypothetical protein
MTLIMMTIGLNKLYYLYVSPQRVSLVSFGSTKYVIYYLLTEDF